MVRTLTHLEADETMLVQSGRPVGVMRTHEWAPRVLIANSNLVGDWATWPEFRRLEKLGLTMYGQMTAGSWIYIGTQGIVQGTYETFAAVAEKRFGGTLAGTLTLTGGCGGMGGAQPLAVTMNGGVCLIVDVDRARLQRRVEHRYLDEVADDLDAAVEKALRGQGRPPGAGRSAWSATAREVFPELLRRGVAIDVVTDQTCAHDPLSYLPWASRWRTGPSYAEQKPEEFTDRARASMARHVAGHGGVPRRRRRGVRLRQLDPGRGPTGRLRAGVRLPGIRAGLHPAAVLRGQGPVPLGRPVRRSEGHPRHRPGRAEAVPGQRPAAEVDARRPGAGSPSRACRPGSAGSATANGTGPVWPFNDLVASGAVSAPIVIGRDHLDCGSVASPYRETEAMADGSDAIADWPLLNALVNTASGASWVSIHHGGGVGIGRSIHAGQVCAGRRHRAGRPEAGPGAEQRPRHGRHPARRRRLRRAPSRSPSERGVRVPMRESAVCAA